MDSKKYEINILKQMWAILNSLRSSSGWCVNKLDIDN